MTKANFRDGRWIVQYEQNLINFAVNTVGQKDPPPLKCSIISCQNKYSLFFLMSQINKLKYHMNTSSIEVLLPHLYLSFRLCPFCLFGFV